MRCPPDLGALRHTATLPTHHTYRLSGQMRVWSQVFGGLWVAEPQIARHVRGRLGPLGSDPTPSTRRRLVQLTRSWSARELWRSVPDRLTDPGHDSTIPTPTIGFSGCRSRRPPTCATRPRCTTQCCPGSVTDGGPGRPGTDRPAGCPGSAPTAEFGTGTFYPTGRWPVWPAPPAASRRRTHPDPLGVAFDDLPPTRRRISDWSGL